MTHDYQPTAPLPHLQAVDKEIYSTFFPNCECPRALSLVEEVYRPFASGYLNLRHHLLDEVVFELHSNHISPVQAVLMYMRIVESHNFNMIECEKSDTSQNDADSLDLAKVLTAAFDEKANNFQMQLEKVNSIPDHQLSKKPLCEVTLAPIAINKIS